MCRTLIKGVVAFKLSDNAKGLAVIEIIQKKCRIQANKKRIERVNLHAKRKENL